MQRIERSDKFLLVKENPHSFIMFIPPDMHCIKIFRTELTQSLAENHFPPSDIQQIELACDEAVTNAITANIKNKSKEIIICRWKIEGTKFILTILDYGKGIPIEKLEENEKPTSLKDLIEKFHKMQGQKSILPFGGVEKIHKNMGQGLKIIRKLMDTVRIFYHGKDCIANDPKEISQIEGSILEIEFHSKKENS
ncbi:MAG: ATP-binding protein [Leptospiraceae bacterium]|nr:ATP-binding protein [Leptospiraceae bacterium]